MSLGDIACCRCQFGTLFRRFKHKKSAPHIGRHLYATAQMPHKGFQSIIIHFFAAQMKHYGKNS